jgi:hypothetical protein
MRVLSDEREAWQVRLSAPRRSGLPLVVTGRAGRCLHQDRASVGEDGDADAAPAISDHLLRAAHGHAAQCQCYGRVHPGPRLRLVANRRATLEGRGEQHQSQDEEEAWQTKGQTRTKTRFEEWHSSRRSCYLGLGLRVRHQGRFLLHAEQLIGKLKTIKQGCRSQSFSDNHSAHQGLVDLGGPFALSKGLRSLLPIAPLGRSPRTPHGPCYPRQSGG